MSNQQLTKDLITKPQLWRLSLELKADALEVVLYSAVEDNSLIHRRISIKADKGGEMLRQLEDTVYDNPLLLSDFSRVHFVIATKRFLLIPDGLNNDDVNEDMMATLWPESDYTLIENQLSTSGSKLLMGVDTRLLAFVRRTFPNARITHQLTPIITYFYNKDRLNNSSKMYVHLRNTSIDIIYFSNGRLKLANTFETPSTTDMLYYILAVAKRSGFAMENDELMLCGSPALRDQIAPNLRKYVNYVMPVVFPSAMFNAGKEAFESPFELIILPLCE